MPAVISGRPSATTSSSSSLWIRTSRSRTHSIRYATMPRSSVRSMIVFIMVMLMIVQRPLGASAQLDGKCDRIECSACGRHQTQTQHTYYYLYIIQKLKSWLIATIDTFDAFFKYQHSKHLVIPHTPFLTCKLGTINNWVYNMYAKE